VLVVDDDEQLCKSLVRGLASEHDVTAVIEARHALDLIASGQRFDAIFCDVMMPVMTGIDMFRALATVAPEQATRIIFLSGGVTSAASRAFLEQTPNPQLDKPFELHKLRELLRERLALAGVKADRGSTGS
jgi:CheY-like chemotaxis protein